MDFFEYASVYSSIATLFDAHSPYWVQFLVGGLCFLIVFIFQGLALFTISTREGYKNRWMSFVPFLNTYYLGVCAQKNKFYNIDTKKIGIAAAVIEAVYFILYIVYYVACLNVIEYEVARLETNGWGLSYYVYELMGVPAELNWAAWMYYYMDSYIISVIQLIYLLLDIGLLICFFQTYASRRYVLFTITSILFPIQGILFFVVRNNKGINYREYVRAEQARQYRMYQQYQQQNYGQNPYGNNPYSQNGSYNRNPYDGAPPAGGSSGNAPDPFEEFGSGGSGNESSPFDDFNNN